MAKTTGTDNSTTCRVFRPTHAEFSNLSFAKYVEKIFKKYPDLPCFKVIPPKDWKPRAKQPNLSKIQIQTPIKQHVFGRGGAFQCVLEEQPAMSAAEFKEYATAPEHQPPTKGFEGDDTYERAFWSSVTHNPPLYGADTPKSLFDPKVSYGWNLRSIDCLLKEYDVPAIPGVTSPMTYFGMWRSFFGWHKEDVDLMSVNYNHFGAPKIWYCVSPKYADRFDAMAKTLFPDAYKECHGFVRHKDILISPKTLKQFNVPFVQTRQLAGEFIVLNAAAYHAGFNLGWNCAEAVNFAIPSWLEYGPYSVPCDCDALPDGVQLDLRIFGFSDSEEDEDSEEEESDDESDEDEEKVVASRSSNRQGAGKRLVVKPATVPVSKRESAGEQQRRNRRKTLIDFRSTKHTHSHSYSQHTKSSSAGALVDNRRPKKKGLKDPDDDIPRHAVHPLWGSSARGPPIAVITHPSSSSLAANRSGGGHGKGDMMLVQPLHKLARPATHTACGVLELGPDQLWRPTNQIVMLDTAKRGDQKKKKEDGGDGEMKFVNVNVSWEGVGRRGGWKMQRRLKS